MTRQQILRAKYVLLTHYRLIAALSAVLIGICALLLVTNVATPALAMSPQATDPPPVPTTHRAGVSQGATVTVLNTTAAFSAGQILNDRSVFPLRNASAPVVTASADSQEARIRSIAVRITYTASAPGDVGQRFFTSNTTIASKTIDGNSGTLETVVDIQSIFDRRNALEEEFGAQVTVTPTIESVATYQYRSPGGETQTSTVSFGEDITAVGALYSLPSGSAQDRHTTGPPSVDASTPLLNALIAVLGGVFVMVFGAALLAGYQGGRDRLGRRITAKRYSEWVTRIESYTPRGKPNVVQVESLGGLVNLAIDMRERVLYTDNLEEYIVMDGDTMYKYRSEHSEKDGATEFFGFSGPEDVPDTPTFDTYGNPIQPEANENPTEAPFESETDVADIDETGDDE